MRIVIDTNVLIDGSQGPFAASNQIIQLVLKQTIQAYITPKIKKENELKINELVKDAQYLQLLKKYFQQCQLLVSIQEIKLIKADPDDDKLLSCALASEADYLITADHHLLELNQFKTTKIVTPQKFLSIFHRQQDSSGAKAWQQWVKNVFN